MTHFDGRHPIRISTILMFIVMVGLIVGVGIDMFSSSDEVQTVETYELPKEEPKEELLFEF
ncbi:hypothetical protein IIA28_14580 [candidate division KSB1 bacterium]|nr:hypothetical protein [candidate division KSB1 bacterium]